MVAVKGFPSIVVLPEQPVRSGNKRRSQNSPTARPFIIGFLDRALRRENLFVRPLPADEDIQGDLAISIQRYGQVIDTVVGTA